MNYYEILGIKKNASLQVVTLAFRELEKKHSEDAESVNIAEIQEAFLVLSDATKRAEYDKYGVVKSVDYSETEKIDVPVKKRWQNFWYYNKWYTYASIFIIIVLIVSIKSCADKVNPDLSVMFLSATYISAEDLSTLGKNISLYVGDYTGNKKVETEISNLPIGGKGNTDPQANMAYNQKFAAEVSLGDTIFYMCDKDSTAKYIENDMLADITALAKNGTEFKGKLIKLTNPKILAGLSKAFPKDIYVGIRVYNKNEKNKKKILKLTRVEEIIRKMQ